MFLLVLKTTQYLLNNAVYDKLEFK